MYSTLEIIQKLKSGERAKVVNSDNYSGTIAKKEDGSVVWEGYGEHFALTPEAMQLKWEVIKEVNPRKYETVSFIEAYAAYQRGCEIGFYDLENKFRHVPIDCTMFYWEELTSNCWVVLEQK